MVINVNETGKDFVESMDLVSVNTTYVHMIYVPTKVPIAEPLHMDTKILRQLLIECRAMITNAPDILVWYLLVIQM